MSSPAIIISITPNLTSCVFTEEFGPIFIHSRATDDDERSTSGSVSWNEKVFQPDIDNVSMLNVQKFVSECPFGFPDHDDDWIENDMDLTDYEICLFDNRRKVSKVRDDLDKGVCRLLDTVGQMKGLKDRLMDASATLDIEGTKGPKVQGHLVSFLQKSDAIVQELISAVTQHCQRVHRMVRTGNAIAGEKRKRDSKSTGLLTCDLGLERSGLPLGYYEALYSQCHQVHQLLQQKTSQNENQLELSDDLSRITMRYHDENHRCHVLIGELNPSFPSMGPIWSHDLPHNFEPKWMNRTANMQQNGQCGLSFALVDFIDCISALQTFWNEMDDVDNNTWVLEPYLPSNRSCCERRIALCTGLSIHFTVDPENPRSVPLTMRFIGSAQQLNDLRSSYQSYISFDDAHATGPNSGDEKGMIDAKMMDNQKWSETLSIRENLETCFNLVLPSKSNDNSSDFIVECGVCYSHAIPVEDDDSGKTVIPNIACNNSNCARSYHESCLLEWLQSLPGASTRFGRIFGQCPYCSESISVKINSKY